MSRQGNVGHTHRDTVRSHTPVPCHLNVKVNVKLFMQAAAGGDKQAMSQAALELLKQLTRMQEHGKVQSQSPAEGLEPLPLEPSHLQELLADLSGKTLLTPAEPSLSLVQSLLIEEREVAIMREHQSLAEDCVISL